MPRFSPRAGHPQRDVFHVPRRAKLPQTRAVRCALAAVALAAAACGPGAPAPTSAAPSVAPAATQPVAPPRPGAPLPPPTASVAVARTAAAPDEPRTAPAAAPAPTPAPAAKPRPWLDPEGTSIVGFGTLRVVPGKGGGSFRVHYREQPTDYASSDAFQLFVLP